MIFLVLLNFVFISTSYYCGGSFNEQYRVPRISSERWEAYIFNDQEYLIQNLPVTWENAKILCRGHHNGSLATLDTRDKAEFLAEALSELQFSIESVWVGARRQSGDDPEGYRWGQGVELRRTAADVLPNELDDAGRHYPMWLNRTHVPVPEGGADCVALERVQHDKPVFLDLPCHLERPFVCEREARVEVRVQKLKTVRCRTGLYHVYDGRLDWHQAAAYCVLRKMALANIATMKCLRKLGLTMLKSRPSIESAWIGARGSLGQWTWADTGLSIFGASPFADVRAWPPMRDRSGIKQNGCLQIDRHENLAPVFLEARCERKMQFICYQGLSTLQIAQATPSDDNYYYVLVRQLLYWQHAFENCQKLNGSLAIIDNSDVLIQLLLVMGENKDQPIEHIWISGRLNMTKDIPTDKITYFWHNPANGKRIPDPKSFSDTSIGLYMPPWLDEEFSMDSSCLNLDRQDHLNGLIYGLPCDTPQYSVCMIEKSTTKLAVENNTEGYESS
ncbi:macrophage mannose receptor 1-like [Pararge aegeria]|uniref:macrophage mannose receptor 1-like n=1 Tax=Pararge aegeria TaxID=116150 RepID=UPI0019D1D55F|nr:macrophage mannose receptor 1-like [Pararge aegeria]